MKITWRKLDIFLPICFPDLKYFTDNPLLFHWLPWLEKAVRFSLTMEWGAGSDFSWKSSPKWSNNFWPFLKQSRSQGQLGGEGGGGVTQHLLWGDHIGVDVAWSRCCVTPPPPVTQHLLWGDQLGVDVTWSRCCASPPPPVTQHPLWLGVDAVWPQG